ncbi:hypothetical protein ABEB36_015557 [Hypothenemus hampei]|uniref:Envelope glycoprotein n=1 Tax=Hypothenemus hampei TaxID=57062 RepID=A0ABD1E1G5_HYPHA
MDIPNDIVGVDYNTQQYFTLTAEEMERSSKIQKYIYVCSPLQIKNMENNPHCGLNEIYQKGDSTACPVSRRNFNTPIWQQLYTTNTWLFISPNRTRIAIKCNGRREEMMLNKTGMITVSSGCIIITKQTMIAPQRTETIPVMAGYIRPVVANLTLSKLNIDSIIQPIDEVMKPSDNLEELRQNQEGLQEELDQIHWHKVKHHSVLFSTMTTLSVLTILLGVVGATKGIRWLRNRKSTVPQSSRNQDSHEAEEFELRPLRNQAKTEETETVYSLPQQSTA